MFTTFFIFWDPFVALNSVFGQQVNNRKKSTEDKEFNIEA